jgi:hypothetical protein
MSREHASSCLTRHLAASLALAALTLLVVVSSSGCSSIEVVRLKPGLLKTPPKTEPLAGIQVSCVGFYVFTLGAPTCDMEKVVNEILMPKAREIGATKLVQLRFRQTPEDGVWWLTKLLWFRTARASAIAVVEQPRAAAKPAELDLATAGEQPAKAPSSAPSSAPGPTPSSAPVRTPGDSAPTSQPAGSR